ncbi:unnamed protein product [Urochloa decumbens]|uniref:laccase n=1 Tax=Urochloa decumbens TaxID=240449 RepID=A0ABC9A8P3_9POAL
MARATAVVLLLAALCTTTASAAVVERTFNVGGMGISQLCMNSVIYTVNQQMPGPTIEVTEGDTLVVHVINRTPYPLSMHWHGIFQLHSGWADGANMITQCPIPPSDKFTYVFTITGQEGTLWWHAHASMLRATIHGALIIKPRSGRYPFPTPHGEIPILLGEWWNRNVDDVETDGLLTGLGPAISDAFTINGSPGDLAPCGGAGMFEAEVEPGKTYLLRIVNAAVNAELFFKIAGHAFTVVAADASYTNPYDTDVVVIAPGQTVDALMTASAAPGRYYMAAHAFESKTVSNPPPFDAAMATAVLRYRGVPENGAPAAMPALPPYTDVVTTGRFYWSMTGLVRPGDPVVPKTVDHSMVVGFGLEQAACAPEQSKCQQFAVVASMNRRSFLFPDEVSLLEALFRGVPDVYSEDFPGSPPAAPAARKATSVRKVNFGDVVEVVLQNEAYSAALGAENHPIHLHGFNFFVLAQGLGRFDPKMKSTYNLVNPQVCGSCTVTWTRTCRWGWQWSSRCSTDRRRICSLLLLGAIPSATERDRFADDSLLDMSMKPKTEMSVRNSTCDVMPA